MSPGLHVRRLVWAAAWLAAISLPLAARQAQEPASYPHDMSSYGCSNRDENACDQAPAPPPERRERWSGFITGYVNVFPRFSL